MGIYFKSVFLSFCMLFLFDIEVKALLCSFKSPSGQYFWGIYSLRSCYFASFNTEK